MPKLPAEFLTFANSLADASGPICRHYFRSGLETLTKEDLSPVTVCDREAETRLRDMITKRFPSHGIIGEEHGRLAAEAEFVWILDPVDGTGRFITGNPLFGTLIGLLHGGRPVLGVIDMPALGERFVGAQGHGTTWTWGGETRTLRTRACPNLDQAMLAATSPYMFKGQEIAGFTRLKDRVQRANFGGDCYNYGLLAAGLIDIVAEADMGVYDYLPLVAVIEGAGGTATDWQGGALRVSDNDGIVAVGDPHLTPEVLATLGGAC